MRYVCVCWSPCGHFECLIKKYGLLLRTFFYTQVVVIEAIFIVDSVRHIPVFGYLDLI
mgnify:CR=1 FL=1